MSGANQMHGVPALTQGLEIIGNGEIRAIVSAGQVRPADEPSRLTRDSSLKPAK